MLVLVQRTGDVIRVGNVGETIEMTVLSVRDGEVRLGIAAPRSADLPDAILGPSTPGLLRRQTD